MPLVNCPAHSVTQHCQRQVDKPGKLNLAWGVARVYGMTRVLQPRTPVGGGVPVGADGSEPVRILLGGSFEEFYRRNFRGLVALTLCLSGSRAAAEDIAQDAMMTALSRWDEVGRLDEPVAWVRRVAANRATSVSRRRMSELRALLRLGSQRGVVHSMPEPDEEVWAAVRKLPRRQRQCVALHYIFDCTVDETARTLGCAQGTVKAHLHQARQTLSARLAEPEGQS